MVGKMAVAALVGATVAQADDDALFSERWREHGHGVSTRSLLGHSGMPGVDRGGGEMAAGDSRGAL